MKGGGWYTYEGIAAHRIGQEKKQVEGGSYRNRFGEVSI